MLQEDASTLDIRNGVVVDADTGAEPGPFHATV